MKKSDRAYSKWFVDEVYPHENALKAWIDSRFSGVCDSSDVVQEAFVKILEARKRGPIVNPRAFLFITARNLVLNHIRHFKYERPPGIREVDEFSIADELRTPLEKVVYSEEIDLLKEAIKSLPEKCREVVTLRKVYGLSILETAEFLAVSRHTVETQSAIGLKKCMRYFEQRGYQVRG
ncbi:MAG: RNA polymerase sigma factor [Opitutales bacterium]|nr:RNA polymerase sigma factor [Opitutales bacterium]